VIGESFEDWLSDVQTRCERDGVCYTLKEYKRYLQEKVAAAEKKM